MKFLVIPILLAAFYALAAATAPYSVASAYATHWRQHTEEGVGQCLADPVVDILGITLPENFVTDAQLICRREDFTLKYKETDRTVKITLDATGSLPCAPHPDTDIIGGVKYHMVTVKFNECGVGMTASPHLLTYKHRVKVTHVIQGRSAKFDHTQIINIDVHCDLVPKANDTPVEPCCPPVTQTIQTPCTKIDFEINNFRPIEHGIPSTPNNIEFSIWPVGTGVPDAGFYVEKCEVWNVWNRVDDKGVLQHWTSTDSFVAIEHGVFLHNAGDGHASIDKITDISSGQYGWAVSLMGWRTSQKPANSDLLFLLDYIAEWMVRCEVALCREDKGLNTVAGDAPLCPEYPKYARNGRISQNAVPRSYRTDRYRRSNKPVSGRVIVKK